MTTATAPVATTLEILEELLGGIEPARFDVRLWDGTRWAPDAAADPVVTIVVERPSALRALLRPGSEAVLAEAYLAGDLSLEGDIYAVPALARSILAQRFTLAERARIALNLLKLPRDEGDWTDSVTDLHLPTAELRGEVHSVERDRAAVTHHYDLSNRFYSFFLDPRMVYSCAIFKHPDEPLETAQLRKLDLVCRKLRLQPGDRLLDVGCGWGALILHAAREYGVEALGITLAERQAELARARIREAGLESRCRVEIMDYRQLEAGSFDRIASIGMFEHVGRARAPEYFSTIARLLRPGGSYLHHAITANPLGEPHPGPTLSDRYVFPDHELIPIGETLGYAEEEGLDIRDLEALREHYALTLRCWVAALEARRDEAVAEVGEATWRAWHLMFAGSAVDFEANRQEISQVLMVKPRPDGSADLPLGRWDWYAGEATA